MTKTEQIQSELKILLYRRTQLRQHGSDLSHEKIERIKYLRGQLDEIWELVLTFCEPVQKDENAKT